MLGQQQLLTGEVHRTLQTDTCSTRIKVLRKKRGFKLNARDRIGHEYKSPAKTLECRVFGVILTPVKVAHDGMGILSREGSSLIELAPHVALCPGEQHILKKIKIARRAIWKKTTDFSYLFVQAGRLQLVLLTAAWCYYLQ